MRLPTAETMKYVASEEAGTCVFNQPVVDRVPTTRKDQTLNIFTERQVPITEKKIPNNTNKREKQRLDNPGKRPITILKQQPHKNNNYKGKNNSSREESWHNERNLYVKDNEQNG